MTAEERIVDRIERLIAEEEELREPSDGPTVDGRARMDEIDVELDQCWDLLRQRRARREAGQEPDQATARAPETVEGYEQ